jgi:hypothetical protein
MAVAADAAGRTLDATLFRDATVALGLNE